MYASSMFSPRHAATHGAATYQTTGMELQVASANAHQLVTLLFEGFNAAVVDAQGAVATGDIERKCRAITRAMRIVDEGLRSHLNMRAGGALAQDLNDLYAYVTGRLTLANVRNDATILGECKRLMQPLHEAWVGIAQADAAVR